MDATMRRMRADGAKYREIGAVVGVPYQVVYDRLTGREGDWRPAVPTRPPGPGRIRGRAAGWVRRLAELGYPPGRVAELLGVELDQVVDFLGRIKPDGRVRPRPAPRRGGEWGYRDSAGPAAAAGLADPPAAAPIAAELGAAEVPEHDRAGAEVPPAPAPRRPVDSAEWNTGRRWGARDPRKRCDAAQAAQARALCAAGMTRGDVAAELGCSVATVGRLLKGRRTGRDCVRCRSSKPRRLEHSAPPARRSPSWPRGSTWTQARWPEPCAARRRRLSCPGAARTGAIGAGAATPC